MKLTKLSNLFEPKYGTNLELNRLKKVSKLNKDAVNFVSRTSKNNGVSAVVKKIDGIEPLPPYTISVAGGGSVLETFLQEKPFYSGRDLYYLIPKYKFTEKELLFYCYCIRKNKFRYSYGRQANKTLNEILLPAINEIPVWVNGANYHDLLDIPTTDFELIRKNVKECPSICVKLIDLFDIKNGIASSQVKRENSKKSGDYIPYVRPSSTQETSVDAYVDKKKIPSQYLFPADTLYVSTDGQGSHTYSYVSPFEFVPNSNVTVLIPKKEMSVQEKIYYSLIISKNRFKFSYGRKPKGDKLKKLRIPQYANFEIYKKDYAREIIQSIEQNDK